MDRNLGDKIDAYYLARDARITAEKELAAVKQKEDEMKNELLSILEESSLSSASGSIASISLSENVVPTVEDWDKFYQYVHRHKAYHLLERRPAAAPYREELEIRSGKDIPGVKPFTRKTLNMSKSKR